MTTQLKAWLEAALWAFGTGAIADLGNVLEGGAALDHKSLTHALVAGLIVLGAYLRKNPEV